MGENGRPPGSATDLADVLGAMIEEFINEYPDTSAKTVRLALLKLVAEYTD